MRWLQGDKQADGLGRCAYPWGAVDMRLYGNSLPPAGCRGVGAAM